MRYLHTMIRVSDPAATIRFFEVLGLQERRRAENEAGRYTLIFLGVPGDDAEVELTHNWGESGYSGGTLRKIRSQTTILSFGATEAEKREGCAQAKKILAQGQLDTDSANLAKEIVASGVCTGYD